MSDSTTKRTMRDEIRATAAAKTEEARQKMMAEAVPQLAYLKAMKQQAETLPCPSSRLLDKTVEFFDHEIQRLEIDVRGEPRYLYNLRYATEFGREANGIKTEFDHMDFMTSKGVSRFIADLIADDEEYVYLADEYDIPSAEAIDKRFDTENKRTIEIDINVHIEDEEEDDDLVPIMTLNRTRINY